MQNICSLNLGVWCCYCHSLFVLLWRSFGPYKLKIWLWLQNHERYNDIIVLVMFLGFFLTAILCDLFWFFSMVLLPGYWARASVFCYPSWGTIFIFIVSKLCVWWLLVCLLMMHATYAASHLFFSGCLWLFHSWQHVFLLQFLFGYVTVTGFGYQQIIMEIKLEVIVLSGWKRFFFLYIFHLKSKQYIRLTQIEKQLHRPHNYPFSSVYAC